MKTSRKESVWVTLFLLLFCLVFVLVSFTYKLKERFIPLSVGIAGLILAALLLLGRRFPKLISKFDFSMVDNFLQKDPKTARTKALNDEQHTNRKLMEIYAWTIGFLILIYLFGFLIAIPVFMLAFLRINGHIPWSKTIAVSAVTWALIYALFEMMLKAELFRGLLFDAYVPPI
jgi:hypothetical protein